MSVTKQELIDDVKKFRGVLFGIQSDVEGALTQLAIYLETLEPTSIDEGEEEEEEAPPKKVSKKKAASKKKASAKKFNRDKALEIIQTLGLEARELGGGEQLKTMMTDMGIVGKGALSKADDDQLKELHKQVKILIESLEAGGADDGEEEEDPFG